MVVGATAAAAATEEIKKLHVNDVMVTSIFAEADYHDQYDCKSAIALQSVGCIARARMLRSQQTQSEMGNGRGLAAWHEHACCVPSASHRMSGKSTHATARTCDSVGNCVIVKLLKFCFDHSCAI